ncbi:class V aminotransferase [Microbacterium sp. Root61]|uniref:aminotransferase class V-fold PLP-dependent enzyme n=1 Tax=Microbacterium sp. Root61 TaxID=1736570 RepID=UPI0006F7639B|nr:aminotransferase class V-fold PLP-dependent enzyme [Microbacterium sp. Root61]KRA23639.1 class V aminotransferase [Microbacterium sp. Root61]
MAPITVSAPPALAASEAFAGGRGYLAACTLGLPPRAARDAMAADLDAWSSGHPDPVGYTAAVERTRGHFARLVDVAADRVAIGSQASVFSGLIAAGLPDGAEVLCAEGDFSSIVLPFVHAGRGIRVRSVPLDALADEITPDTALVAFSIVQSACGQVADAAAIVTAARRHGARTYCDATQAVGWLPVDASQFDALVCHAYKWLCAPRGVAFLTISADFARRIPSVFAGWYAGDNPWTSCYGDSVELASDARRFDVSPAWQAFVGAEAALELFATSDPTALHAHATGLATAFRDRLGLVTADRASAIVSWRDPEGCDLARLTAAGIIASGRAGRVRVAFHVFNDAQDVDLAVAALGR